MNDIGRTGITLLAIGGIMIFAGIVIPFLGIVCLMGLLIFFLGFILLLVGLVQTDTPQVPQYPQVYPPHYQYPRQYPRQYPAYSQPPPAQSQAPLDDSEPPPPDYSQVTRATPPHLQQLPCPNCRTLMTFNAQYQKWYCPYCVTYV